MKKEKPKTESVSGESEKCTSLTVERTFGSQDLIELVADYIAEKIEIDYPDESKKCKRADC